VHSLAQRVFSHIRQQELLHAGDRVGVAVSGGIDSVALLRLLLELRRELGIVLSAVHFNHKLRGAESDADEEFVANLSHGHDLEFYVDCDDVARVAADERVSVETAARELRYGFFRYLLGGGREADPQGLKPSSIEAVIGTAKAVPFPNLGNSPGAEAPLFHPTFKSPSTARVLSNVDKILTAHTLDDQAETVLMRMIRGTGMRGLGGIHSRIAVEDDDSEICGEIVRPLLAFRRCELARYLKEIGQTWREDTTNLDARFTRNRLRQRVLPLLEKEFNPAVAESLAELAEIARGEEDYWENEIAGWMGTAVHWFEPEWGREAFSDAGLVQIESGSEPNARINRSQNPRTLRAARPYSSTRSKRPSQDDKETARSELRSRIDSANWLVMNASVSRAWFLGEPAAVQRRLVKAIGEHANIPLEFKHVEEILKFAEAGKTNNELSLPNGWKALCNADELIFLTPDLREPAPQRDYEYSLAIPGRVTVHEIGSVIQARIVRASEDGGYNPDHLLDAESLPGPLRVRNWRPGDRFWPAHTKSPRKIKELLQDRHIAEPQRKLWPVILSGGEMVWVRGFPCPAKFRVKTGHDAIMIAECSAADEPES
jgi:tRNA(Ile)-lysidine synthetase-like protein